MRLMTWRALSISPYLTRDWWASSLAEVALTPVGRPAAATSAAERAANPAFRGGRDMAAAALKMSLS